MSTSEEIWQRVKEGTDITTLKELARAADTNYQYLAKKIRKGEFSTDWAFKVAQRYNLSTDWILTGKSSKASEKIKTTTVEHNYIILLDKWLKDFLKEDPKNKDWFERQLERTFPEFDEWMRSWEAEKKKRKVA